MKDDNVKNSKAKLKAGLRGPVLLEDFILREKITHFDHERIPERIVHARGSAAHGFCQAGAVPCVIAPRIGALHSADGAPLQP